MILEIIGILALLILGKFIYDTYLTNNTNKKWDEYKLTNPADAKRIEVEEKKLNLIEAKNFYRESVKIKESNPQKAINLVKKAIKLNPQKAEYKNLLKALTESPSESLNKISKKFPYVNSFLRKLNGTITSDTEIELVYETPREVDYNPFMNEHSENYFVIRVDKIESMYYLSSMEVKKFGTKYLRNRSVKTEITPFSSEDDFNITLERNLSTIQG